MSKLLTIKSMLSTQSQNNSTRWYYDPKKRAWLFQILILSIVAFVVAVLVHNTQENLAKQNIASGFGFLGQEAGFEISETIIEYWADETYRKALWVGVLNTFKVAIIGNFFAVLLGIAVGILRLSPNWLVSKMSLWYIELTRNVPLLLQLFFWYAIFTEILPPVKEAWNPLPNLFLTQRGFFFPIFKSHTGWTAFFILFGLGLIGSIGVNYWAEKKRQGEGEKPKTSYFYLILLLVIPLIGWAISGAPLVLDKPELGGFNFSGGYSITPEFMALMFGLILYTGAFNAEIVRAGIESVSKGQWEAGESLGLSR
ncbi:MAG: ABC transporter permease subunit, partial [Halobacteriovoraceae bacterium]|nr:ABC transporter permease subunit [Halobacteriovoraceae bacterium]